MVNIPLIRPAISWGGLFRLLLSTRRVTVLILERHNFCYKIRCLASHFIVANVLLGGGNSYIFTPKIGEDDSQFDLVHICSNGLVQPFPRLPRFDAQLMQFCRCLAGNFDGFFMWALGISKFTR